MEEVKHTFPAAGAASKASSRQAAAASSPARRSFASDNTPTSTTFPQPPAPQPHRPASLSTSVSWSTPTATVATFPAGPAQVQATSSDCSSYATNATVAGRQQLDDCQRPSATGARDRVSEPRQWTRARPLQTPNAFDDKFAERSSTKRHFYKIDWRL